MRGNLVQEPLPEILSRLAREGRNGILGVTASEKIRKFIYWERGGIIFASSNDRNDRIGECLMRQGMLLESDFIRASQAMGQGKRFGQILVELNIMNQRELLDAVTVQILDIIYSLFQLSSGPFEFMERENSVPEDLKLNLSTGSVILEGVRRMPDIGAIQRGIGDLNQTFIPGRSPLPGVNPLSLKPIERQLLEVITHPMSVMDAVMMTQNPPNLTLKALFGLISAGLIDRNAPQPAPIQPVPVHPPQAYQPPVAPPPIQATQPLRPIQPPAPIPVVAPPAAIPTVQPVPWVSSPQPVQNPPISTPPPVAPPMAFPPSPPPSPPLQATPIFSPAADISPSGKLLAAMKDRLERATTPHEILGIRPDTPRFEIRDAYVRLAKEFNPERYKDAPATTRFEVDRIFHRIKEAYETLLNAPSGELKSSTGQLPSPMTGALTVPAGRATGPLRPPGGAGNSGSLSHPSGRATGPLSPPPSGLSSDPLDAVSGRAPTGSQTTHLPPHPPSGSFNPPSGRSTGPLPPPQLLGGTGYAPSSSPSGPLNPPSGRSTAPLPPPQLLNGTLPLSPPSGSQSMVGAVTERERKAETLFEEAKRKISEQDYSGAVSCLREAVELFPNSAKYRLVLGTTLSAFPTFIGEAEIHLRRVAQIEPTNVTPLIALGQMYLKAGMKPQAEKAFQDVLKIDPFSKIARDALGAPEPEKPKSFLDRLFKG